ncbi:hypothetical protein LPJ61_006265, partial [Coemansia biformis]
VLPAPMEPRPRSRAQLQAHCGQPARGGRDPRAFSARQAQGRQEAAGTASAARQA